MKKLRICLISRYPPIPGGTSSTSYWVARRLGELGHRVYVVTDFPREKSRSKDRIYSKGLQPKNVKVYTTEGVGGLSSLAVKVVRENDVDIIDARYLLPYGLSGFVAKTLTGKSLVVKHAGSDMLKYFDDPVFRELVLGVLKTSDIVITDPRRREELIKLGIGAGKLSLSSGTESIYYFFTPKAKPIKLRVGKQIPVIVCLGKVCNRNETLYLFRALGKIKEDFVLLLIPEGDTTGIESTLKRYGIGERTVLMNYQPPWVMPGIYACSTVVVCVETGHLPSHIPLSALEALYSGRCVMISKETHQKLPFNNFQDGKNIVVVDPKSKQYQERLKDLIKNPEHAKDIGLNGREFYVRQACPEENFGDFLRMYHSLVR